MKIIFFDIDGTLLDKGSNKISQKTQDCLDLIDKNGFGFSVATGRGWPGVKRLGLDLNFPVVTELGSKIISPESEEISSLHELNAEEAIRLISELAKGAPTVSFWTKRWKRVIFGSNQEAVQKEKTVFSEKYIHLVKNYRELANILQSSKPSLIRVEYPFEKIHTENYDLEFHPFSSKKGFEITAKSINKASGIAEACKITKSNLDDIFLIGNSQRDLNVASLLKRRVFVLDNKKSREKSLELAVKKVLANGSCLHDG